MSTTLLILLVFSTIANSFVWFMVGWSIMYFDHKKQVANGNVPFIDASGSLAWKNGEKK